MKKLIVLALALTVLLPCWSLAQTNVPANPANWLPTNGVSTVTNNPTEWALNAATNAVPADKPGVSHMLTDLYTFFLADDGAAFTQTNWSVAIGPNFCGDNVGASAFVAYPISPYLHTGISFDYIAGSFMEANFNNQIGTPKRIWKLDVYPYVNAGVGYVFNGTPVDGSAEGKAVGIAGAGCELMLPIHTGKLGFFTLAGEADHYTCFGPPVIKTFLKYNFTW